MGARTLRRGVERRLGGRARVANDAGGDGHRHGRIAAHPLGVLRDVCVEADPRPRLARRDRAARLEPRPRGADGALARGLRAAARGDGRARPAPSRDRVARPARARTAARSPALVSPSRLGSAPRGSTPTSPPGFDRALDACRRLGAELVEPPGPGLPDAVGDDFVDVLTTEMLVYHRRFDAHRDGYRPSLREWVETGERRALSARGVHRRPGSQAPDDRRVGGLARRAPRGRASSSRRSPSSRRSRGDGYDHAGTDYALISLTHLWDWTGFPVAALPAGVGRAGLPVGVSLVGRGRQPTGPPRAR